MTLDSNTTLVATNHRRIVAAKHADALLDDGSSMLERGLTVGVMDRVRLHTFLVYMVMLVDLLLILPL
jgi:hypothetical protein